MRNDKTQLAEALQRLAQGESHRKIIEQKNELQMLKRSRLNRTFQ